MKKIVNKFPDELKMKVVQEYLSTTKSQQELMQEYNILGHSSIPKWMRKFGVSQPTQQQVELKLKMAEEATNKTKRELELESKVKELEKELDTERFKTKALNTMINIIERDLKIPVRKKFGTKQ
jgi:transposase